MDNLSKEQRRRNMQNIKSKGTVPEKILAKALRQRNVYFAKNTSSILGKPDFVFRRKKVLVFVDSDFWHCNPRRFIMPKTRLKYWENKIQSNVLRDKRVNKALRLGGWQIIRLWERDVKKDVDNCIKKIIKRLDAKCQ